MQYHRDMVIESIAHAVLLFRSSGPCLQANRAAASMLGLTPADVRALNFRTNAQWQQLGLTEQIDDMLRSGEERSWSGHLHLKVGRDEFCHIGLLPFDGPEGRLLLMTLQVVTDRMLAEERFFKVVEAAPNAMVLVDGQGRIEMVNAQTERLFGYHRDELLGKPIEILVPERFRGRHPMLRGGFLDMPKSRPMGAGRDLYALRKDGQEVPVEIGLNPIETDDGVMVLSAIVDISDRKLKEDRILRALKEKEVLLGEVHHRVKNNLQIIDSLLSLQSDFLDNIVAKESLVDSKNRIRSMAIIHQILYQSNDFSNIDLEFLLDRLVPALVSSYNVGSHEVTVNFRADKVYLPIGTAVPTGLLINELITNALKHAFPGGRRGSIVVTVQNSDQHHVDLTVRDDGVGLPPDLDLTATDSLGLQLVHVLVEQLHARLSVHRVDPTEFSVRFRATQESLGAGNS